MPQLEVGGASEGSPRPVFGIVFDKSENVVDLLFTSQVIERSGKSWLYRNPRHSEKLAVQ